MTSIDADTIMVCAGVLLSVLAFAEIYSTWAKTRRTERREGDPGQPDGPEESGGAESDLSG